MRFIRMWWNLVAEITENPHNEDTWEQDLKENIHLQQNSEGNFIIRTFVTSVLNIEF